jgi:hypothetical protein
MLADRLVGTITIFYLAILTGRAFSICTGMNDQLPFELVYSAPHINWTVEPGHRRLLPRSTVRKEIGSRAGAPNAVGPRHQHWNLLNPESNVDAKEVFGLFSSGNLSELGSDKEILFFTSNRGATVRLFDNPFHAKTLHDMGLTAQTAFGCAVEILFKPVPAVMDMMKPALQALRQVKSIGIHIRVGDHVFHGADNTRSEDFNSFFQCAEQIEMNMLSSTNLSYSCGTDNLCVKWLIFSDSGKLRQQARQKYGKKIHTLQAVHIEHTFGKHGSGEKATASSQGFLHAASEHWLLGLMDFQIVDSYSGFGQSGAMRTFKNGKIFMMRRDQNPHCENHQYLSANDVGSLHSGV